MFTHKMKIVQECTFARWIYFLILITFASLSLATLAKAQPLTELQYRLSGLFLEVSPSALTVPRGIATQVNTTVIGKETLPSDATVYATLRGPSFPGTIEIKAAPGKPIYLPPLSQPGTHFLEDIRLAVDADLTLPASPSEVTVNVLKELLVGDVTSRPLSLEEIQDRGIQFDENSFKAFEFTIAFITESEVIDIKLPVLVPVGLKDEKPIIVGGLSLGGGGQLPDLNRPYFTIEPIMLEPIVEPAPGEEIPPIPGIMVIPGNIAFLNQFFSVLLIVSNQAPDGTPLVVTDVRAEIYLPPGADNVVGDILKDPPFQPGEPEYDNPLRIAKTDAGRENIKAVLAAGADDESGTEDDVDILGPQESGTTEFLVEGVREGGHIIEIEIQGTLKGLPSGPVEVAGHTSGAVVVRDPDFSLTFIHPDTVRAGERYEMMVHLQNTSQVAANLVTVNLDPRNLSGARLLDPEDATQLIETIPAGDSGTVIFPLEAMRTGQVIASTLELSGETGIVTGRRIMLCAGVSEQGVPLSPDTLLLPPAVTFLREQAGNDDLTFRAVALLGEAHSIATAPRGSLPPDVGYISSDTVIQRARELSEAAVRLELSYRASPDGNAEPIPEGLLLTLQDLYFDFLGAGVYDDGWDALYRDSRQARLFGAALADVVVQETENLGIADLLALQSNWADTESYRSGHITVMTQTTGAEVPVVLELIDKNGRVLGGSFDPQETRCEIPGGDLLNFYNVDMVTGQFAALTKLDASPYSGTLKALKTGSLDLGIVVAATDGQLRHVIFRGMSVSEGEELALMIRPGSDSPVVIEQGGVSVVPDSEELIPDGPPEVLGVVQNADRDISPHGRVVAILFNEDIDQDTAKDISSYAVNPAVITMIPPPELIDENQVTRALVQFGDRIVFLGFRDPVGPFVPRTMDISGVRDLKGQEMVPVSNRMILPDPDIGPGAQLTGRVVRADGSPVPEAEITYFQQVELLYYCDERIVTIKNADENGGYNLDFVLQNSCGNGPFRIRARDPVTGEEGSLSTKVRADGQRLTLDIVLVGRGSIEGTVRDDTGELAPDAFISIKSITDFSEYQARTDQNGFFRIEGVPVGPFGMEVTGQTGSARLSGAIPTSDAVSTVDVTLFALYAQGVITGEVCFHGSKASDFQVILAKEDNLLDGTTTDAAGTFSFENVHAGSYHLIAIDNAAGLTGEANITITDQDGPDNPVFVRVILAGTGTVSGTVYERVGTETVAVPGALISGGTQIVTADANGRYLIPAVPVGIRRIEALNPETGARGSLNITILTAGQSSTGIDILLEPLGTVTGRVFDPNGQPLSGQEVRILIGEGMSLAGRVFFVRKTQTAADGTYTFDKLELREYPLMAVRGNEVANGTARLSSLVLQAVVDLNLIQATGSVSGMVMDESGLKVAAEVRLKARVPNAAGILEFKDAGTTVSDPDRGFTFEGLFPGPFTVTASSFFSPEETTVSGYLPEGNPVLEDLILVLKKNTATLSGCVLTPDGTEIEPVLDDQEIFLPLSVFITSRLLRDELGRDTQNPDPEGIRVDASEGCYISSIPLPPDYYTVQVTDDRTGSPTFGLTGQAKIQVKKGEDAEQDIRLLGLGSIAVEVVDASGEALTGVNIMVRRTSYPNDVQKMLLTTPTNVTPAVFHGLSEGRVTVSVVVSTVLEVDVGGRDELRGFGGHASGEVLRDALQVIRVSIDAAGVVSGRFLKADGVSPATNAQVELHVKHQPIAFDMTDSEGAFEFKGVPVGSFSLEGFDPSTGRSGSTTGQVELDGQHVIHDLELGPIGTVSGVVLDASRTEPVAGAEVSLCIGGHASDIRRVTAGVDGTFVFQSVPGGVFALTAVSPDGLSGQTEGSIEFEGEVVDLELVLESRGRIQGTVFDATGAPVSAAQVTLNDSSGNTKSTQAGIDGIDIGIYTFVSVPMGPFTVEARPAGALTPGDGGHTEVEVQWNDQIVSADVTFQGTVTIGVMVSGEVGSAPVVITVDSHGLFGGRAFPTTIENEVTLFEGIPRAPLTVSAKQVTPFGTTISASASLAEEDLPAVGGRLVPDLELVLSQVGSISGIVTDPEGTPVSVARVSLYIGSTNVLMLTGEDGTFEFMGLPLDNMLILEAETNDGGRAKFIGSIDGKGVVKDSSGIAIDTVDLVLDVDPPEVSDVQPLSGDSAVPTDTDIVIQFSEPIDAATLTSCSSGTSSATPTFRLLESSGTTPAINDPNNLCDDSNVVPVDVTVSSDGTTATLITSGELQGNTPYTVIISRGVINSSGDLTGGVRDLVGHPLDEDFVWQFVTRDNIPPRVVISSPFANAINVSTESIIRVTFSEPIDPASIDEISVSVRGSSGQITGRRDLILGNTVLVFTPTDASGNRLFLLENEVYTVDITGVMDPADNVQLPEDELHITFRTVDTIPPVIYSVTASSGARSGQSFLVAAMTYSSDVASVEFFVDGVLTAVTSDPFKPGEFHATLVMPERTIQIATRAVDHSGNVGVLSTPVTVALLSDEPPSVTITAPNPGEIFSPGTTVTFTVEVTDDVAVAQVKAAVSGAVTAVETKNISPPETSAVVSFDVAIPPNAPEGTLSFSVFGTDNKGQTGDTASTQVTVRDDIDPEISIISPLPGEIVFPGVGLDVTIKADDEAGVAELWLDVPEIDFQESFTVSPSETSITHTFMVPLPDVLDATALTLIARAVDRSGLQSQVQRILPVWAFEIDATATRGLANNPEVPSANTGQTILITGKGLDTSLLARFITTGDDGSVDTVTSPLFAVLPDGTQGSVVVPATASTGSVRLEASAGEPLPGEAWLQIVPTLNSFSVPVGEQVVAGVLATISGSGFREGYTSVDFPSVLTPTPAADIANGNTILTVVIPEGITSGEMYVVTDGGTSNGFPILGTFGLVGTASEGTAVDPMLCSANPGQTVTVTGESLSTSMFAVFTSTDDAGTPGTVEAALVNINEDGTQASVTVPVTAVSGVVKLRPDGGEPFAGEAFIQIVPTLTRLIIPAGELLRPGISATLLGAGFRIAETEVVFSGADPVVPNMATHTMITVTVPENFTAGSVYVVTDGGSSRELPLPGTFDITGVAEQGVPTTYDEASANVDQILTVTGENLSTDLVVVFPGVDDDGMTESIDATLIDIAPDGLSASVTLPQGTSSGPVYLKHTDGVPTQSSVFLQVVPTLESIQLPPGEDIAPGVTVTLVGSGFVEGGTEVEFPGAGRVPAQDVFGNGLRVSVTIPDGIVSGPVKVVTQGGSSAEIQINYNTDVTPPEIVEIIPDTEATDVPINTTVTVRFSEPINAETITSNTVYIKDPNGLTIGTEIQLVLDGTGVVLRPIENLQTSTTFTVNITDIEDEAGNVLITPFESAFTTGGQADVDPPQILDVTPDGSEVPVNSVIVIKFSEPIDPATINEETVQLRNQTIGEYVSGSLSIDAGGHLVYFMPSSPLAVGTQHRIYVRQGVEDVAGNPLDIGYPYYYSQYFTTSFEIDVTSPEVLETDPADGDAGVPTSAKITVQMSEALDPISVTSATVVLKRGDTVLSGALSLLDGNRRIQFVPTVLLEPLSGHTLTLAGLRDMSGNVLAAPVPINFTTGSGADLVSPTVVSTNPAANATGVVRNVVVTAEFSEPVNPVTVNQTTVKLYNYTTGQWVDGEVALDASRTVAICLFYYRGELRKQI
jgi:hypothetical protein